LVCIDKLSVDLSAFEKCSLELNGLTNVLGKCSIHAQDLTDRSDITVSAADWTTIEQRLNVNLALAGISTTIYRSKESIMSSSVIATNTETKPKKQKTSREHKTPPKQNLDDENAMDEDDTLRPIFSATTTNLKYKLEDIFNGCIIYVYPSVNNIFELMRYLIAYDAVISNAPNGTTTHVITYEWDYIQLDHLRENNAKVKVVTPFWAWHSINKKERLDETPYLVKRIDS